MSFPTTRWRRAGRIGTRALAWTAAGAGALIAAGLLFVWLAPSYHAYVITGQSMEPAVSAGDVVIVGPPGGVLTAPLAPGEVITYQADGGGLVTHRVVAVDGERLVTKGDAVGQNDPQTVAASQVSGVVMARIPKVGLIARFLWSRHGLPLLVLVPACAGLFVVLMALGRTLLERRRTRPVPVDPTSR